MKFTAVLALTAVSSLVAAQELSACATKCIADMITKAKTEFGCKDGDVQCYCKEPRFGFGMNDCTLEACGPEAQQQVVAYGQTYCLNQGTGDGPVGSSISSIVSGASSTASSAAAGASSSASSALSSASSEASSAVSSASDAASSAASSASDAVSSAGAAASSATSSQAGGMAFATAAPMAGVAAMAALLAL